MSAQAAETQTVVRQEGMLLTVDGWLLTRAERETAWAVLTDYARFPEFVPGIFSNRVVESNNGVKTIAQRGEVVAGQFRMPYDGIMRVEERAGEGLRIQFQSGLFKDVQGEWQLQPGRPLKLIYRMRMDLMKSAIPAPMAPAVAELQVRTWVEMLGREMERRQAK